LRGNDWQIFANQQESNKLYWDLSVIGRWISHPRSDGYATSGLGLNVTALGAALGGWSGNSNVDDVLARLQQQSWAQGLSGNKAYYAGDYMVSRFSPQSRNADKVRCIAAPTMFFSTR
jgi:hypothetical protein